MLPHFLFEFWEKREKKENPKKPSLPPPFSYLYFHSHLCSHLHSHLCSHFHCHLHSHLHSHLCSHLHSHLHPCLHPHFHSYSYLCLRSLRSNCSFCFCHILHRWSVTLCTPPHAAHLLGPPGQSLVSCTPAHLPHLGLVALHLLCTWS